MKGGREEDEKKKGRRKVRAGLDWRRRECAERVGVQCARTSTNYQNYRLFSIG